MRTCDGGKGGGQAEGQSEVLKKLVLLRGRSGGVVKKRWFSLLFGALGSRRTTWLLNICFVVGYYFFEAKKIVTMFQKLAE